MKTQIGANGSKIFFFGVIKIWLDVLIAGKLSVMPLERWKHT